MAESDREIWDARYRERAVPDHPFEHWLEIIHDLPRQGPALDVACGTGHTACFLARQGLDVLGVDVSPVGLALAVRAAEAQRVRIRTQALDLEVEPPPFGPFIVITCMHYLQRSLWPRLVERLAPGGMLATEIATVTNLERNAHPSRRWLVEPGELGTTLRALGLRVTYEAEDWFDGTHAARIVARK